MWRFFKKDRMFHFGWTKSKILISVPSLVKQIRCMGLVLVPWASSLRSSLTSELLTASASLSSGALLFLREPAGSRFFRRPSIAKIRGTTSSSFSKHHCNPWRRQQQLLLYTKSIIKTIIIITDYYYYF